MKLQWNSNGCGLTPFEFHWDSSPRDRRRPPRRPVAFGQASPSLNACQKAMAEESATYVRAVGQTVDKCLAKMSAAVVQNGATTPATAAYCAAAFTRLADTGAARELGTRFDIKVGLKCDASN